MFSFLKKRNDEKTDVDVIEQTADHAIQNPAPGKLRNEMTVETNASVLIREDRDEKAQITAVDERGAIVPFDRKKQNLLNEKLLYIFRIVDDDRYPTQPILIDKVNRRRWQGAEDLGFPPDSMITEEELWRAYIKQFAANAIRKGVSKSLMDADRLRTQTARIDDAAKKIEEVSRSINEIRLKLKQSEEMKKNKDTKAQKVSLLRTERFPCEGLEYPITPKAKKLLLELEKHKEWTTAKNLKVITGMSETYIRHTFLRLMNKGFPINSYTAQGKRFFAFARNENNDQKKNMDSLKINPDLIVHALEIFNYLYGRWPSTTDIASHLKSDVTDMKNELSRLESRNKVKSTKTDIGGKKIKTWQPVVVIDKKVKE